MGRNIINTFRKSSWRGFDKIKRRCNLYYIESNDQIYTCNARGKLKEDGIVKEEQVLMGFPHPSGANVNRVAQFEANRDNMIKFIKKHFI